LRAYDAQLKEMIAKPALPFGLVSVAENATSKVSPIDQAKHRLDQLALSNANSNIPFKIYVCSSSVLDR
jgi:hypothetical protein